MTDIFLDDVKREVQRARSKFPSDTLTFTALVEEAGELAKALLDEDGFKVWKEAVQLGCMATRIAVEGDNSYDKFRASKGLDNHRAFVHTDEVE